MVEVSIIIVSYNTRDITCKCIRSIIENTAGISYEIIVVDNNSSDDSVKQIRNEFPAVILIENPHNSGFAAGQNLGILNSNGEFVLVLNSDIIILDDAIAVLANALRNGVDKLSVVGPRVQQLDGSLAPSARRANLGTFMQILGVINRYFPFREFLPEKAMRTFAGEILGKFHDNYRPHDARVTVDYVDGMCAMIRRSTLEDVGLFDEQYFFDYEIIDLSNRIRSNKWKIEFLPEAEVIHIGHASRKKTSRIIVETVKSELTYYAKHCPNNFQMIRWANYFASIIRLAYLKIMSLGGSRDIEIAIYGDILSTCKNFKMEKALNAGRIPRLPRRV